MMKLSKLLLNYYSKKFVSDVNKFFDFQLALKEEERSREFLAIDR